MRMRDLIASGTKIALVASAVALSPACAGEPTQPPGPDELIVGPTRAPCTGVDSQLCLLVSREGGPFERFYSGIEGFVFRWGQQVTLRYSVHEVADPPADGSSLRFVAEEVLAVDADVLEPVFDIAFPDPRPSTGWFAAGAAAGAVSMLSTAVACAPAVCGELVAQDGPIVVSFELTGDDARPLRAVATRAGTD